MKVICFIGKNDSGKSTIINKILKDKFGIVIFKYGNDSCLTLQHGGKTIGICGYGDTPELLDKHLANLVNCDLIICVRRLDKESEEVIRKFFGEDISPIYCNKEDGKTDKIRDDMRYFKFGEKFEEVFKLL